MIEAGQVVWPGWDGWDGWQGHGAMWQVSGGRSSDKRSGVSAFRFAFAFISFFSFYL